MMADGTRGSPGVSIWAVAVRVSDEKVPVDAEE
jgi:hypothetical protein